MSQLTKTQAKKIVEESVNEWNFKFSQTFGEFYPLTVKFAKRGRSVGGTAASWSQTLNFNLDWAVFDMEEFTSQVVPHEIAHIYAAKIFRARGHDYRWKMVMRKMGLSPDRTTNKFSGVTPARKTRKFVYITSCGCDFSVGIVRHNRIQGGTGYSCSKHRVKLTAKDFYAEKM